MHISNDVTQVAENNPHVLVVLNKHGWGLRANISSAIYHIARSIKVVAPQLAPA